MLEAGFPPGSARGMDPRTIARAQPGYLLEKALEQMSTFDSSRADPNLKMSGSFRRYYQTVFLQRFPESVVGVRNAREFKTLALILDLLLAGDLAGLGDVAVQRFKALESAVGDGGWTMARHHELIPSQEVGLSSEAERSVVARSELQRVRLEDASRKVVAKPGAGAPHGKGAVGE